MAARDGMAHLITRLRGMTNTGETDYSIKGVTYWTDDQLQDILDTNRMDIMAEPLMVMPRQLSTTDVEYRDYYFSRANVEEAASGTAVWQVVDSRGSAVATAIYTVNYRARHIRFNSDTDGTAYFLHYRSYDLDNAAGDVWEQKAAQVADRFDFETDNHKLSRSQLARQYRQQAQDYRRQAGGRSKRMYRDDVNRR